MNPRTRFLLRIALASLIVLHALAHAVLPFRGIVLYPPQQLWMSPFPLLHTVILLAAFSLALVALFAGGIGVLGSRVLAPHAMRLVELGVAASVVALVAGWSPASWWGLAIDATIVGALVAATNSGLHPVFTEARPSPTRWRARRIAFEAAAVGVVVYVGVATALWPWHRTWGTTIAEQFMALPGDDVIRDPAHELMHGITIDAPPEAVWPWLAQIGQDRAGFYSYDWLERAFLADVHNADEIRPEWQHQAAGELVRATQPDYLGGLLGRDVGWRITHFDPPRAMVLEYWGAFVLQPTADGRTRLLIRTAMGGPDVPVWAAGLTFTVFELPHFIMQRKMMLGIKERAERAHRTAAVRQNRTDWEVAVKKLRTPALARFLPVVVVGLGLPVLADMQTTGPKNPDLVLLSVAGQDLFEFYCASCHGRDGKGNGRVAPALKVPPPDLTTLAQQNRGTFPAARVEGVLKGEEHLSTPAHGASDMPVWGPIFKGLDSREEVNARRIENLVKYIESIQAKAKAI